MQLLSARQRVAAVSLLRMRAALLAEGVIEDASGYELWCELVCSEMQRLGVVDAGQVREFCERAGVPPNEILPLRMAPPTAA